MPEIYIPGVRQQWGGTYGWSLNGGPRKFILHSTESDSGPAPGCVNQLAAYLDGWANPHVVWDPWTGDMAMTCRADWGGGALLAGNRDGSVVIQVEAVGRAGVVGKRPFIDSPMLGWDKIVAWSDSWGIPRVFPAGLPLAYPASAGFANGDRSLTTWNTQGGFYGHSQVAANDHGDPGLVATAKVFPGTSQEDDITTVLPTIGATDVGHPKSIALLKQLLHDISPGADTSTVPALDKSIKAFQGYFGLTPDGLVGPATWRSLLAIATGGGK